MDKLIRNGIVINGTGEVIEDAVIAIKEDRIAAMGPSADFIGIDAKEVVDAQGGYILPGLIDTHVHMMMEIKDVRESLITPFSMRFYEALTYMKRTLDAGITTVRDAGYADLGVKQAIEHGLISGPRMQISINPLTITGGHGDNWMVSDMDLTNKAYPGFPSGICDGPEQVRQKVREMLRAGADIIKVHATGGVMSPTDHPEFTQFSMEELRIIVEEATYRKGRKVMAHAQGAEGVKQAVRAGIHSIEHGIFLDDEAIELMLEHGTYLVPTLLAPVSVVEASEANESMPAYAVDKAKEVMEIHQQSVARAYEAGVKIAMGTDAGVMAHGMNLRELALMCDIGMSPMEAIIATTKVAAECLGWEDKIGTIAEGKLADIVIVQENPLENIASMADTNNIKTVIQGGKLKKQLSIQSGIPS
ncbi:amidohydrolase family protein [Terribacillus aidingensis]|uniref:metal-dependent hydrolase family protein n=1 Tax=Terribacillus aidingensis TaxID=586416 RepID=UPI0034503D45